MNIAVVADEISRSKRDFATEIVETSEQLRELFQFFLWSAGRRTCRQTSGRYLTNAMSAQSKSLHGTPMMTNPVRTVRLTCFNLINLGEAAPIQELCVLSHQDRLLELFWNANQLRLSSRPGGLGANLRDEQPERQEALR